MLSIRVAEHQMSTLGQAIASALVSAQGGIIYLDGTLGMGKTTLAQVVIKALGWQGRVKSPTYTLLEPYEGVQLPICHLDLYRLADPEELEFLGLRDYLLTNSVWLVEWPERGAAVLPPADVVVEFFEYSNGRNLRISSMTDKGHFICQRLALAWQAL